MKLRVSLAQTCPVVAPVPKNGIPSNPFDILQQNLADTEKLVEKAKGDEADVVIFPEYWLQGLVDQGRQYLTYPAHYLLEHLQKLAKEHDISIVGTIVFPQWEKHHDVPTSSPFSSEAAGEWDAFIKKYPAKEHDPKLQNTAVFIEGGTGKVIGEYVKRNLWHPERDYLHPGQEEHRVFDTKWGKCGFLICWDVSHPNSGQALVKQGVDIVFAPTYWIGYDSAPAITEHNSSPPDYENEVLSSLSCARSFETETVWIMCNAGGTPEDGGFGGSGVWMPFKGKLGGVKETGAGYKVVDVDFDVLHKARELYKVRVENNN